MIIYNIQQYYLSYLPILHMRVATCVDKKCLHVVPPPGSHRHSSYQREAFDHQCCHLSIYWLTLKVVTLVCSPGAETINVPSLSALLFSTITNISLQQSTHGAAASFHLLHQTCNCQLVCFSLFLWLVFTSHSTYSTCRITFFLTMWSQQAMPNVCHISVWWASVAQCGPLTEFRIIAGRLLPAGTAMLTRLYILRRLSSCCFICLDIDAFLDKFQSVLVANLCLYLNYAYLLRQV